MKLPQIILNFTFLGSIYTKLFSFFLLSSAFSLLTLFTCNFMWFIKSRAWAGIYCCVRVCAGFLWLWVGLQGCAPVCMSTYVWVCASMHGCARVWRMCVGVLHSCVWDEYSDYLLETRVLTSCISGLSYLSYSNFSCWLLHEEAPSNIIVCVYYYECQVIQLWYCCILE